MRLVSFEEMRQDRKRATLLEILVENSPRYPSCFFLSSLSTCSLRGEGGAVGCCCRCCSLPTPLLAQSRDQRQRGVLFALTFFPLDLGKNLDNNKKIKGVIMLLRELDAQAREEGGAVYMLNGNHESLNVCGDFRYATPGGFREAALAAGLRGAASSALDAQLRARLALYAPGGPMALELALNPTVLVVGRTMFAHGGIMPSHVAYGLERLNGEKN